MDQIRRLVVVFSVQLRVSAEVDMYVDHTLLSLTV